VAVTVDEKVSYTLSRGGQALLAPSSLALVLAEGAARADGPRVVRERRRQVDQTVRPVVREKRKEIRDRFHELTLTLSGGLGLVWRAYDNGAAYRWTAARPGQVTVAREEASFAFAPDDAVYFPEEEGFHSHNERRFPRLAFKDLAAGKLASLPLLVATRSGVKVWLSEADLSDYPGLWVRSGPNATLVATLPAYPAAEEQTSDRNVKVTRVEPFLARTRGTRAFPWRVLGLADRDGELLDNQLVYLLSEDTKEDFSWVRPGKVPWDWYNANNVYGVDFKSGVNTATYKHYVDFAARYGLEYVILDEGWSKPDDLLAINPEVDLPVLLAYAREKGVGIIPWVIWLTLDKQFAAAFDQFERWGVKGLKIDFMQRDDQKMVNFYERVTAEAARRKLLVDFHGAYKPTGLRRRYPNLITREGVHGLENNKWADTITPEHNLTLPFTRQVAGPMDYTPGAMLNANKKDFRAVFDRPMSQGTRCHQLAMYVVYESPLQMLADSPTSYLREPDAMDFLSRVPVVWDETVVLDAKVGEYVALARRSAQGEWYLGAMTNWTPRDLELDLSFLADGTHRAEAWQDGVNADRVGNDYKRTDQAVTKGTRLRIHLAPGGGWVARVTAAP
jgi:alpha-glucosidase